MKDETDRAAMLDKPESYTALLAQMTPEIYQRLLTAVELGKWENGDRLTPAQQEHCLQAIIAWDHKNLPEQKRVAFIDRSKLKQKRDEPHH